MKNITNKLLLQNKQYLSECIDAIAAHKDLRTFFS